MVYYTKQNRFNRTAQIKNDAGTYYGLLEQAVTRKIILIGNSSSIIKEAPFFNTFQINVGSRQLGRLSASTQINIKSNRDEIKGQIIKILGSEELQPKITENPYHVDEDPVIKLVNWLEVIINEKSKTQLLVKHWL